MFLKKIDLPYCLVVFFVVCPRLRPFWSVFGELALFWCSTAKRKEKDKAEQWFPECPSLEANNSAGKLPPASIPPEIQSRDVAVPCRPFTRFVIPQTERLLAMLLSLARSASAFRARLFQTAVQELRIEWMDMELQLLCFEILEELRPGVMFQRNYSPRATDTQEITVLPWLSLTNGTPK